MQLNNSLLIKLTALQAAVITISNYLVHYKFAVFGWPLAYSVWCTPAFMVITDLMVRLVSKSLARTVLVLALGPGMLGTMLAGVLYGSPPEETMRITIASGICYLLPMLLDVSIFAWLRERYQAWYVAPGVSGVITTAVMTYIFWGVAFAGGPDPFMRDNWYVLATNQILVKIVLNLIILLPAYKLLLDYIQAKVQPSA